MKDQEFKIGLIGAGHWGKNHLRVFNNLGLLKMVCDFDENVLIQRNKEYPNLKFTNDFGEVLSDKEIGGIVISTPASTHYDLTQKALLADRHVLVEKPMALKVEQGEELAKLAYSKNLILMVGHLLQYHTAIIKLKRMIGNGDLGNIRYIWSNRLNFGKLRPTENVLWSFAPHDISLVLSILGFPQKISAMGEFYLQKGVPDTTLSILKYKNRVAAYIFVSWLNPFKEQKFSIIGSKQMVVFDGIKNELTLYPHKISYNEDRGYEAIKADGKIIEFDKKEPLVEEAKHFLECIRKNEQPKTNAEEGLQVLRVLNSCEKSLNIKEKGELYSN